MTDRQTIAERAEAALRRRSERNRVVYAPPVTPFPEGLRPDIANFARATRAEFVISDGTTPALRWRSREIIMPPRSRFQDDDEYHSTLMHEFVHWTGPRVGREFSAKPVAYAREEMIAEMGAAMLCAHFHIKITERHVEYLERELNRLPGTTTFELVRAVQDAHRAVHYLLQLAGYTT